MDRETAEWLLAGSAGHTAEPDTEPLAHLLALAAAPARPHEFAGEEAAVAAFRRPGPAPVRPWPGRRALLAKLLTVKVAALLAASTLGGVAVAAAAGRLPDLPGTAGVSARETPPAPAPPPPPAPTTGGRPAVPPPPSPTPPPSQPSLADLCRAAADDHGRTLDQPRFAPLVTAAGGQQRPKVRAYCAALLHPERAGEPSPSETESAGPHSKTHPSQPPRSVEPSPGDRLDLHPSKTPDREPVPPS